jgi:uncharacterized protein YacL
MALTILRLTFIGVAIGLGFVLTQLKDVLLPPEWLPFVVPGMIGIALVVIAMDAAARQKSLEVISAVYFGLIVGLILAYVVSLALSPLIPQDPQNAPTRFIVNSVLALVLCYLCISFLLQTRNDFRFIIPYVEFTKESKGAKPYIVDSSAIIDGRLADVAAAHVLEGRMIIPRFVIAEVQGIADSSDRQRRGRGRRGLDILNRLRSLEDIEFIVDERELPEYAGQPVDMKLVLLAKVVGGRIVTHDYNLNKVAQVHGVGVINLNDVANALKPGYMAGETLMVKIIKPGETAGQGVGYLEDGTMIVVEGARDRVGQDVRATVTSVLQTSAGRMIFGKCEVAVSETAAT